MEIRCTLDGVTTLVKSSVLADILIEEKNRIYVTDTNVSEILPDLVRDRILVLPAGEAYKKWESVERIITFALEKGLGRDAMFVGIGGGVICDMTAFAASIYMRGVEVELVPTTLLSMVDASLGGKTGADFTQVKNIIGTFHPAQVVHICTDTLYSLDAEEYRNGLAEVIKHAFLTGGKLLDLVSEHRDVLLNRTDRDLLEQMIFESILVKQIFIEKDPKEKLGERAKLNLGHTFGHALETISNLSDFSHGAGVAWGMARAVEAGILIGETDEEYASFVKGILIDYGFDIAYRVPEDKLDEYMHVVSHDKKKRSGVVRFILQRAIGDTFLSPLPVEVIREVVSTARR